MTEAIKPMLAKPAEDRWIEDHHFIQPKLDGVRMTWNGTQAHTRTGKLILGVPKLLQQLSDEYPDFVLDGELYCHSKTFQEQLSSIRRTVNIEEDESVGYHIYDHPIANENFAERWERVLKRVQPGDRVQIVETIERNKKEPLKDINIFEARGYEGTMLRNASGLYKFGKRSSDLMKIKTFLDDEFVICGLSELQTHEKIIVPEGTPGSKAYADGTWYKNGETTQGATTGAVVCLLPNGETFEVGTGMDDATRQALWDKPPLGKKLTVKFQELTDDGVPRFPVFIAIRDYE